MGLMAYYINKLLYSLTLYYNFIRFFRLAFCRPTPIKLLLIKFITYLNSLSHYIALHYMPIQYTAILHGCKNGNFQMKNCDFFSYHFAVNIDSGYSLVLMSTNNICLRAKIRKFCIPL